jgi:hypothetical protein
MQRHAARRASARSVDGGARIALRNASRRTCKARIAARRARPEVIVKPDFVPLAIH